MSSRNLQFLLLGLCWDIEGISKICFDRDFYALNDVNIHFRSLFCAVARFQAEIDLSAGSKMLCQPDRIVRIAGQIQFLPILLQPDASRSVSVPVDNRIERLLCRFMIDGQLVDCLRIAEQQISVCPVALR